MPRKQTKEEFITKARAVHGDRYNYDKVVYINAHMPVIIICPKHGPFPQMPYKHSHGQGCYKCAKGKNAKAQTMTKEEFIAKARAVHGDKYCYDKVEYINNHTPVIITCPKHGDFLQMPYKHLDGQGCSECAGKKKITKEGFIKRAKKKHCDKYDYSLIDYIKNNRTNVKIKCNTCGCVFEQRIDHHLNGHGCPECNKSHLEEQTESILKKNNITFEPQKKFSWLKCKREMPLDFYLPDYNIAIECHGIQHFLTEGNGYFNTEDVRETQRRDTLKLQLCMEHGIPIYYVKYNDNVEEKLSEILCEVNNHCKHITE